MSQLPGPKTQKELAFIQDLLIAPDWGERFAALIDEHVKVPKKGSVLYAAAGTGGHALVLREQAGPELELLGIDENEESIEIARAKAITLKLNAEFTPDELDTLKLEDNQFALVIGDLSLAAPERVPAIIAELIRVTKPGGKVAIALPTSSSFGEFFSIFWEALYNSEFADKVDIESLLNALPTVSDVEDIAAREGVADVAAWTQIEGFTFKSGEEFLNAPLISDFLMKGWMKSIPDYKRERVTSEIAKLIDADHHEAEFLLTVKATLLMGKKPTKS